MSYPKETTASLDDIKRFAAAAAHEVGNSLAAIIATAQLLKARPDDAASVVRLASRIETIATEMSDSLTDLKVLGTPTRRDSVCSINTLAAEAVERLASLAHQHGVPVQLRLDPTIPPILCDRRGIERVFVNLIKNALEAASGVTTHPVAVKTRKARGYATIVVYNRGTPIPEELQRRLFEPFFSTKPQGSGLGLVITHEIVTGHGGTLHFRSGPKLGTIFRARFPISEGCS